MRGGRGRLYSCLTTLESFIYYETLYTLGTARCILCRLCSSLLCFVLSVSHICILRCAVLLNTRVEFMKP